MAVAICLVIVNAQSTATLQPPSQIFVYDFVGGSSAVVPPAPTLKLGSSFSIEFWLRLDRETIDAQYMRVLFSRGFELDLLPGTHQLGYNSIRSSSLTPGQWYHVAIVSDNLQLSIFLDGQSQGRTAIPSPPSFNSDSLILGAQTYGDGTMLCCGFPGSLRQFRIWGRALAVSEVASVATKLLSGTEPGLLADWPFDEGHGTILHDLGPNRLSMDLKSFGSANGFPRWLRTAILDGGPYFQVQSLSIPRTVIDSPAQYPIPIDFDSDGNVDLLICMGKTASTHLPCAAFRNDGKGNFSDVTLKVLGPDPPRFETPRDYAIADFNGDGRPDVFISDTGECPGCNNNGGHSVLLLQTADGRLVDATAAAGLPLERMFTHNIAAGDIDGDGDIDLYYQNYFYQAPVLFLNDGRGHFAAAEPDRLPAILSSTQFAGITARFIDLNHDGRSHLYVGLNHRANQPHDLLLLNDGRGYFTVAPDKALPSKYGGRNWGTVCIRVADFDGDGWPDLANCVYGGFYAEGAVQLMLNNRDGTFRDATDRMPQVSWQSQETSASEECCRYIDPILPVDINGDGFMDLLVQGAGDPSRLFLNAGPGAGGRFVEVTDILPHSANRYAVADLNGDGSQDLAALVLDCCSASVLESWLSTKKVVITPDLIPALPTGPFFQRGGVLNSASFSADRLAPGQLVTIFGRNLGPETLAVAAPTDGVYPKQLFGTRVLFDNIAAPLLYTSGGAVSVVVPFGAKPQTLATLVVEYQGKQSAGIPIPVSNSAPGLFTGDGSGTALVLNVDAATRALSLNGPQNPAASGGLIVAYLSGGGQTNPLSVDGVLAPVPGKLALPVEAALDLFGFGTTPGTAPCAQSPGCKPVEVLYAGPAPGIVAGVTQINMRLPNKLPGSYWLGVSVGGVWSQEYITVSIR